MGTSYASRLILLGRIGFVFEVGQVTSTFELHKSIPLYEIDALPKIPNADIDVIGVYMYNSCKQP